MDQGCDAWFPGVRARCGSAEYDEGNPEKYINTQLMVLTRDNGEWRVRSISWSTNQP